MAFLAARIAVLPLHALEPEFARLHGRVLGVGSGHGLVGRWMAEMNPDVEVEGVDLDPGRVALAEATQERAPRVRIRVQDVRELSVPTNYDAAVAVDLLHHVPYEDHAGLAAALARAVRPGGTLLIKDIARTPRWKYAFNRLHDRLVTGSGEVYCREPEETAALFAPHGFAPEQVRRIAPLSPYPHYLVRMRRT